MNIILYPPESAIAFNIFNLEIRWYGIIMACAIFVGILLSAHIIYKRYSKTESDEFLDIIPFTVIFAIIGARLFYVIGDWNYYSSNVSEIIMLNHGGLSIYGAILFGIISLYFFSKIKKNSFYKYSDIIALVMPLCQLIGRFGNFVNQEAYGLPSNLFIKTYIYPNHRFSQFQNIEFYHPAFLYESLLNLVCFMLLLFMHNKLKLKEGTIFSLYLLFYSVIRFFIEWIRIDSVLYVDNIPIAQIISILIFIFSILLLLRIYLIKKH